MRELELARLARVRAREGALLVAEELRLQQAVGDRSQIDRHEGLVPARALPVDGARDQLFAGAALAGDEHGGVSLGHLGDQLVEPHHRGVAAHQLVEAMRAVQLRAQVTHLALKHPLVRRLPHQGQDLLHIEGLHDVVVRAGLDALHRIPHLGHRGDQDHRNVLVEREDARQHRGAALARHAHVQQRDVDAPGAEDLETGRAVHRLQDLEILLENDVQRLPNTQVIIDDEGDGRRPVGAGLATGISAGTQGS